MFSTLISAIGTGATVLITLAGVVWMIATMKAGQEATNGRLGELTTLVKELQNELRARNEIQAALAAQVAVLQREYDTIRRWKHRTSNLVQILLNKSGIAEIADGGNPEE